MSHWSIRDALTNWNAHTRDDIVAFFLFIRLFCLVFSVFLLFSSIFFPTKLYVLDYLSMCNLYMRVYSLFMFVHGWFRWHPDIRMNNPFVISDTFFSAVNKMNFNSNQAKQNIFDNSLFYWWTENWRKTNEWHTNATIIMTKIDDDDDITIQLFFSLPFSHLTHTHFSRETTYERRKKCCFWYDFAQFRNFFSHETRPNFDDQNNSYSMEMTGIKMLNSGIERTKNI